MTDDDEKELKRELLAVELRLRRKQEFWETPRNIAILVGLAAAIAAAIGFCLGYQFKGPPAPGVSPIGAGSLGGMRGAEFIDAVQTTGIVIMAAMIVYVVVRLDRTLTGAAEKIQAALTAQRALQEGIERAWTRVEAVERMLWERNEILPAAKTKDVLKDIRGRLAQLEARKDENPPLDH
jgi:hypothetical protein